MKRILSIILTTVLLLGVLAACGDVQSDTTPVTPTPTTPTPITPAPTTPAPTTPAPTTPAPTTPALTTPAPTTPALTTPVVTTPVEMPHTPAYAPYIENPYSWEQLGEWGILPERSFDSPNGYLGTYNGCSVYAGWSDVGDFYINNIGGIQFWYGRVFVLTIKDGERHELTLAYEKGLLTTEDLQTIALCWYGDTFPEDPYDY